MTTETPNVLFPGRPNYTGPTSGWFGLLHHSELFETSHNVQERIAYVKANKPDREVSLRLHNMVYLGAIASTCDKRDALNTDNLAKCDALYADYLAKRDALYADNLAKRDALYADNLAKRDALNTDNLAKCDALYADYLAKRDALYARWQAKRDVRYAHWQAKRAPLDAEVLAYILSVMPDCAWNGKKLTGTED